MNGSRMVALCESNSPQAAGSQAMLYAEFRKTKSLNSDSKLTRYINSLLNLSFDKYSADCLQQHYLALALALREPHKTDTPYSQSIHSEGKVVHRAIKETSNTKITNKNLKFKL